MNNTAITVVRDDGVAGSNPATPTSSCTETRTTTNEVPASFTGKRAFLICPVRGVDPETSRKAVEMLELYGWTVHWPPRDTDQNDPVGLRICTDNAEAIRQADAVYVVWDGNSQGCLFDLGVAFALGKKVFPLELPAPTEGKSFQNMILAWTAR